MTLILAFKLTHGDGEAVLVSSDSKATAAFGIAYEVKKIHPIRFKGNAVGIVSGAGDSALVKAGFKSSSMMGSESIANSLSLVKVSSPMSVSSHLLRSK